MAVDVDVAGSHAVVCGAGAGLVCLLVSHGDPHGCVHEKTVHEPCESQSMNKLKISKIRNTSATYYAAGVFFFFLFWGVGGHFVTGATQQLRRG